MKTFREYLAEAKLNEKEIVAGKDVYKNMKVGDIVVNSNGEEIKSINKQYVKTICLDHRTASIDKSGVVFIHDDESTISFSKAEIEAIKKL